MTTGFVRNSIQAGTYSETFTNVSSGVVTHNLGYKPASIKIEESGEDRSGKVVHNSVNQFTVSFKNSKTFTVRYK